MSKKAYTVVLTGGPCSGKTTVQDAFRQEFGSELLFMPEVASMLLANGYPRPGLDIASSDKWFHEFQEVQLPLLQQMERLYVTMAEEQKVKAVVFDRGILDGAAYMPKDNQHFLDTFQINLEEAYSRYDLVIHLESVAKCKPKLYSDLMVNNPARFEEIPEAQERDHRLQEVWKHHPNWHFIPGEEGIAVVVANALDLIKNHLV